MADQTIPQKRMDELTAYVMQKRLDEVRQLLSKNGVENAYELSNKDAQLAFLKAIKDSATFRTSLADYLTEFLKESTKNFVDQPGSLDFVSQDLVFMNAAGPTFSTQAEVDTWNYNNGYDGVESGSAKLTGSSTSGSSGSFWGTLGSLASPQNLNKLFNVGVDTLSANMQANANKASEERALEAERLRLQQLMIQNEIAGKGAGATAKKGLPTAAWIGIGVGGVVLIATIVYFATRKKA